VKQPEQLKEEIPKIMKEAEEEPVVEITPEVVTKIDPEAQKLIDLEDKVTIMKERGNLHFKKRNYKEAIKAFSEAYNTFTEAKSPKSNESLCTKVTQVLTNRSLAFHQLNQQASALSDATIVLTQFDPQNQKALFRRAHAYKAQEKWEDAVRDLQ
jgi:tetratricopeptide (TPR) repeat protein